MSCCPIVSDRCLWLFHRTIHLLACGRFIEPSIYLFVVISLNHFIYHILSVDWQLFMSPMCFSFYVEALPGWCFQTLLVNPVRWVQHLFFLILLLSSYSCSAQNPYIWSAKLLIKSFGPFHCFLTRNISMIWLTWAPEFVVKRIVTHAAGFFTSTSLVSTKLDRITYFFCFYLLVLFVCSFFLLC